MVIHIAEEQTLRSPMNDQSDVASYANRPEALVFCLIEPMKLHTRSGWVHLEIEGRRFDEFLFLAGKSGEAI